MNIVKTLKRVTRQCLGIGGNAGVYVMQLGKRKHLALAVRVAKIFPGDRELGPVRRTVQTKP